MVRVGHRHEPAEELQHPGALGVHVVVARAEHAPSGVDEERGEDVQHPREVLDEGGAGRDEDPAEDERTQHAEEEHPVLILAGDGERGEDDGPDEDVVHGEGLFDQIAGEVLLAELGTPHRPHQDAEGDAQGHPDDRPDRRLAHADDVRSAVRDEIDDQHHQDHAQDGEPHPHGNTHAKPPRRFVKVSSARGPYAPDPAAGTY